MAWEIEVVNTKTYEKNIKAYRELTPDSAKVVELCDDSAYDFNLSRTNEQGLECITGANRQSVYSNYSPTKEAERWFKSLNLEGVQVLYVFGVGLGYYYLAAKKWLEEKPDRYLVFIEDDPAMIKMFLKTSLASEFLDSPQVQLHLILNNEHESVVISWLTWHFILLKVEVSCLDYYRKSKDAIFARLSLALLHQTAHDGSLANEYLYCNELFFENFYQNTLKMPQLFHGNRLFGKFKGIPAIICGAGPSLSKVADQLGDLKNHALLLAGGSAINALEPYGISAHFAGGIDPNQSQKKRAHKASSFELPFFYRNRWNCESLHLSHGPKLYLNGCGGYSIASWLEHELDIEGAQVEEGHNVINFLIEVARYLGCNPIILVGMDLAFTGDCRYAKGVVANEKLSKERIEELNAISRKDIFGNYVSTLRKWIVESEWIGSYAKNNPQMRFINATEGGLGFPGVENLSLREVKKQLLTESYDLCSWVSQEIQMSKVNEVSQKKVLNALSKVSKSLKECANYCEQLDKEINKIETRIKKGKSQQALFSSPKLKEIEEQLSSEPAYKYILKELNSVRLRILERTMTERLRDKSMSGSTQKRLEKIKINKDRIYFLKKVAKSNLATLEHTIKSYADRGYDVSEFEASE